MQGNTIKRTEREFVETLENLCEPLGNSGETGLWDKRCATAKLVGGHASFNKDTDYSTRLFRIFRSFLSFFQARSVSLFLSF